MKTLILTEKPSVARDFGKALKVRSQKTGYFENETYIITWALGHLLTLYEPKDYEIKWSKWHLASLPIIPFEFKYKPIQKTANQLQIIQALITGQSFQRIVIATDAGREGEVIARLILQAAFEGGGTPLNFQMPNILRFWTSQALTPRVIQMEMNNLKPYQAFERLWQAGYSRQIADWLVGMNGSRIATLRMNDLFSVGRVQTAVLALIVERFNVRQTFESKPYWLVHAQFENEKGLWWGTWFKEKVSRFEDEGKAKAIVAAIQGKKGKVTQIKRETKHQPPPLLYSLTDLQRDANRKFGLSAKKTLQLAQSLYESKKCLSYPRTDARVLGTQSLDMIRTLVKDLQSVYPIYFAGMDSQRISLSNQRVFNDQKLTDHHALIPLCPIPANATALERKVYGLVLKRFAAVFYPDFIFEQTEIITKVIDQECFRTRGRRTLQKGWQRVYEIGQSPKPTAAEPRGFMDENEQEDLPPLVMDDEGRVKEVQLDKKKTLPPPEYTEASLLKEMINPGKYVTENELKQIYRGDVGLGTQATRAQIIETLIDRNYVVRERKKLIATEKGCHLIAAFKQCRIAQQLTSPEETARWELRLERIARGGDSHQIFLEEIKNFVRQLVDELKTRPIQPFAADPKTALQKRPGVQHPTQESPPVDDKTNTQKGPSHPIDTQRETYGRCPVCGGAVIEGKRGYGCANYREEDGNCRFVIWKTLSGKKMTSANIRTLLDGKTTRSYVFKHQDGTKFKSRLKLIQKDLANPRSWEVVWLDDKA